MTGTSVPGRRAIALLILSLAAGADANGNGNGSAQASGSVSADRVSVDLRAVHERVAVAEPVAITLTATAPQGWSIQLPELPPAFGELRVTDVADPVEIRDAAGVRRSLRFQVESFLPGRHSIAPLEVQFSPAGSSQAGEDAAAPLQRATPPVSIRVRSTLGLFGSRGLREIDGPVRVPWTWREWTAALGLAAGLGLASYALSIGYQHWLASRPTSQRTLLKRLERLDEARLARAVPHGDLVVSAAEVVRESLEINQGPRSIYRTTDEWTDYLSSQPDLEQRLLASPVERVLREADAVKFAGRAATAEDAQRCLEAARRVVQRLLSTAAPATGVGR